MNTNMINAGATILPSMLSVPPEMIMTFELVTPEKAEEWLATNTQNRNISKCTVAAYVSDMVSGNWDERVGSAISIDEDGKLRDGQHRLTAVVVSGVSVYMWVCRNVSRDGIYDNNRKRSNPDQVMILRPDFDKVYKSSRFISVARTMINHIYDIGMNRKPVTPKEVIEFTEKHKPDLDKFFLVLPQTTIPKISLAVVHLSLFMAFMKGIEIDRILNFYDVLCTGMSTQPEEFPIIAYRNYLKDTSNISTTLTEICRCQYALKKYLTGSCTKRSVSPKELIYPFPYC